MSEKEKEVVRVLSDALETLPKEKKEYLLGVADGMAAMAERRKTEESPKR